MIEVLPRAEHDIEVATDEIDRNLRTPGEVFQERLQRTLELLEAVPHLGALYEPQAPEYPGLRVHLVRGWRSYAVFYLPRPDGITVVRVLHTSRNLAAIFAPDPDPSPTPPGS